MDGVRALAVLAVVIHHSNIKFWGGGFVGVDLFFVLSGFLITTILMREAASTGGIAIGAFLLRRALRLMPPLFMVIVAMLAVGPIFWPDEPLGLIAVISGLYMADYASALFGDLSVLGHTWSLSVEEHFYLIWPLVVLGLASLPQRSRIKALAVVFIVATLWRLGNAYYFPAFEMTGFRFDTRVSGLILGALIAVWRPTVSPAAADAIGWGAVAALATISFVATEHAVAMAYLQPVLDIAAGALIVSLMKPEGSTIGRVFSWGPAAYIGLISYSIYLGHYPIALALKTYTTDWRVILPITIGLSITLAALSYAFVEKPLQDWRHRRFATA